MLKHIQVNKLLLGSDGSENKIVPGETVERMVETVERIKRFGKNNEEVTDVKVHIGTNTLQMDKKRRFN